jgi:ABC-type transporter Mla subunit MlaD
VIQAVPSDFVRLQRIGTELLEQANAAAGELRATLAAARGLVGERERATIGAAIGDAGRAAAELSRAGETLNARLERLGPALEDLSGAAHRLPGLTEKAGKTLDEAGEAARAIGRTARQLSALSTEAAPGLATLSREGMPELVALLKDLRALAGRLDRLAGDLEQDPNLLLYGRPRRPGPGER